jgi:hypothetical protein
MQSHIRRLSDGQLCERTFEFAAALRLFQIAADEGRAVVLDRTLPGWSLAAREEGFRQITRALQNHQHEVQSDFQQEFEAEALALEAELMARLGIAVRRDGVVLIPLRYNAADYLEELAQRLVDDGNAISGK